MPPRKSSLSKSTKKARVQKQLRSRESAEERELRLHYTRVLRDLAGAYGNNTGYERHINYCRAYSATIRALKNSLDSKKRLGHKLTSKNSTEHELWPRKGHNSQWVNVKDSFKIETDCKQEVLDTVENEIARFLSNVDENAHCTSNIKTEPPEMSNIKEEIPPVVSNVDETATLMSNVDSETAHCTSNINTEPPEMLNVEEEIPPVVSIFDKTAPVVSIVEKTAPIMSNVDSETAKCTSNIKTEPPETLHVEEIAPVVSMFDKTAPIMSKVHSETAQCTSNMKTKPPEMSNAEEEPAPVVSNVDTTATVISNVDSETAHLTLNIKTVLPVMSMVEEETAPVFNAYEAEIVRSNLQRELDNILFKWLNYYKRISSQSNSCLVTEKKVEVLMNSLTFRKNVKLNEDKGSSPAIKKRKLRNTKSRQQSMKNESINTASTSQTEVTPYNKCNFKSTSERVVKMHLIKRKGELFACEDCDFVCKNLNA